jgi:hypothetical protein
VTTEISVETTESILIRRGSQAAVLWCGKCGMPTEMARAEDAAAIQGVSPRSVYRWVEAGRLHFSEQERGIVRICLRSLSLLLEGGAETKAN